MSLKTWHLIVYVNVLGSLMPEVISWSMEGKGKSMCIAELRAEYSASRVDNEISFPQNGPTAKNDDVPSSRLRGGQRVIRIAAMKACEVDVDITVEVQCASEFHNHAHVAGAVVQIANESFDC